MLSICTEFHLYRWQRVAVDGSVSEWIPIISGTPQGIVLGPLLFILYTCEIFQVVENRLFAYADDSTQLAIVCMPAGRPAAAASLNGDFAGIWQIPLTGIWQEWSNHW